MFAFIVRRLISLPFVIFAVSLIIVGLLQILPPTQRAISFVRNEQQARNIDIIIDQYGLDKSFAIQYGIWLREASQGNLGYSRSGSGPVVEVIKQRLPVSAELALFALFPIIGIGIIMGTAAALNKDKFIDQFSRVMAILGWSLPTFVFGIWVLAVFYGGFGLFGIGRISNTFFIELAKGEITTPTGFMTIDALINGRFDLFWDTLVHLFLPVLTLAVVSSAQIMRVMRASLLEALSQDYVRTAKAKGLAKATVDNKHARRNALIPVITLAGFTFAGLLNGVVVTETIFNIPGLGQWAATAAVQLDVPAILGFALLVAFIIVITNLVVDILYALVDPRIRYN